MPSSPADTPAPSPLDRACSAGEGPPGPGPGADPPGSRTSVMNYTYFDSARRDMAVSAAPRRKDLTAADVAAMDATK